MNDLNWENTLIKFGIWQMTVEGFCCSCCGYKLQASGFPAICPQCCAHMLTVKTRERRKDDGIH